MSERQHVYDHLMNCINCGHPHVGWDTDKYSTPCEPAPELEVPD